MSRWIGLEQCWQDVRYGARLLLKEPAVTGIAILTLALGIGANTAIFSLVNGLMIKPFPYPGAERIVVPTTIFRRLKTDRGSVSFADIADWKKESGLFDALAAYSNADADVTGGEEPERVPTIVADEDYFRVMGSTPVIGRAFSKEENLPNSGRVVVLTDRFWKRHFAADPNVIGRSIELNGIPHKVIGVMPPDSTWPDNGEIIRPFGTGGVPTVDMQRRDNHAYQAVARLRRGVSVEQAQAKLTAMGSLVARQYTNRADTNWKLHTLRDYVLGSEVRDTLLVLLGAVTFVLLIACVNVANLLLARGAVRSREIAVRSALGAGRKRLVRQFLAESVLLSAVGGLAGVLVGSWGLKALIHFAPQDVPRLDQVNVNPGVLAFTAGLCLLTAFISGLMPAVQAARTAPVDALREFGRGLSGSGRVLRMRSAMMVAELALAIVLLAGAGLLIRSFAEMQHIDPGFPTHNLLTMRIALPRARYQSPQQLASGVQQLLDSIRQVPGVVSASAANALPLHGGGSYLGRVFLREGQPEPPASTDTQALWSATQPGFFQTLGVPLLDGRLFTDHDTRDAQPVIVISRSMARQMFPNENPLGKRIRSWRDENVYREIVGVVGDVRYDDLTGDIGNNVFLPQSQETVGFRTFMLLARTADDPMKLAQPIRAAIWSRDNKLAIASIKTMDAIVDSELARTRFSMFLLGIFAATALVLAGVGIYGVMSYTVAQRTREIGIRLALGAVRADVLGMVARQAMVLAGAGVLCGLLGSLAVTRLMKALLYNVSPTDTATFATGAAVLVLVALAASYVPARRATKVDPIVTLRYE